MTLTSLDFRPVVTAAQMRAAEARVVAAGTPEAVLMQRAGAAATAAILGYDPHGSAIVVCGPGNNGGDGYVVARLLAAAGVKVTVAADAPPGREPARAAAAAWTGRVVPLADAEPAEICVDALYGTGLTRAPGEPEATALLRLTRAARVAVALDAPSGVTSDDGAVLGEIAAFDLTVAFGALKPAHCLQPSRSYCGRIMLADIGIGEVESRLARNPRPVLQRPDLGAHKYMRGHVVVLGGGVARGGAARLAARAALHVAGAVTVGVPGAALIENAARLDAVMVRRVDGGEALAALIAAARPAALVAGPGLGSDARAASLIEAALASGVALVLDGDAFTHFAGDPARLAAAVHGRVVLTPHEGEFVRMFGALPGSKVERACAAAALANAVVVLKGADTVIAAPDGKARINDHAVPWLATAGSGDVLAGLIGGLLAAGLDAFEAASAGVWLHGELGLRGGAGVTADDLPGLVPAALRDL